LGDATVQYEVIMKHPDRLIEVFSSGGGTQSTAIAALIVQGKLPKPDLVVIADTDRECETTWDYLRDVVRPAFESIDLEVHRIGHEWASVPEQDWKSHNGNTVLLPMWTNASGTPGKLSGYCSNTWKVETIDRYLSKTFRITRSKYRKWIGFSFDEWRRAQRIMAGEEGRRGLIWLPLISGLYMKRHEAIQAVKDMGWPEPPRSRCWMCPNQSDGEWLEVKENRPDEFRAACELEELIQQDDPHAWLHKSCKPLASVKFDTGQDGLFDSSLYCSSGVCFV
jgi:hypothetical protein